MNRKLTAIGIGFVTVLFAGCSELAVDDAGLTDEQRCGQFNQAMVDLMQIRGLIVQDRMKIGMKIAGASDKAVMATEQAAQDERIGPHLLSKYGSRLNDVFTRLHDSAVCPFPDDDSDKPKV